MSFEDPGDVDHGGQEKHKQCAKCGKQISSDSELDLCSSCREAE